MIWRTAGERHLRLAWLVSILYLLVNLAMLLATVPGANLKEAADGLTWFEPAVGLLQHGWFVDLHDPTRLQTYRPPMFPLFAAAAMKLAGAPSALAIVAMQVLVLFLTGLVMRRVAEQWCPGYENAVFALTLFNPNALSTAHLVQSDTVFTFFVVLFFSVLCFAARRGTGLRLAVYAGAALGAACLTRPTPQFIILLLPLLFPLIEMLHGGRLSWRVAAHGTVAAAVTLLVIFPWALHLKSAGKGLSLSSPEIEYRYVWDQVQMVDAQFSGLSYAEAGRKLEGPGGVVDNFIKQRGTAWPELSPEERWRELTRLGYRQFMSYPIAAHARTAFRSAAQFFIAGGAGNFHNLFGIDAGVMSASWFATDQSDPLSVFRGFVAGSGGLALTITILVVGFTAATRLLDVVGLISALRRREWALVAILVMLIGYFAAIHVYVGNSRYRLSVDPLLILLAIYGISSFRRRRPA